MDARTLLFKIQIAVNIKINNLNVPPLPITFERVGKIYGNFDIVLSNKPSKSLLSQFNNLKDTWPTIIRPALSIGFNVALLKYLYRRE